jgi:exodeoxyribonuclease-3
MAAKAKPRKAARGGGTKRRPGARGAVRVAAAPRRRRRLRIATWNVNSLRIRLDALSRFVDAYRPDVVCLQEIKVEEAGFPRDFCRALGYPHIAIAAQRAYHGVAILSRLPLAGAARRDWCGKGDARHLVATLPGGIELHNFYVPAGGDIPDPAANEKFAHKLRFVDEMTAWFKGRDGARMILVGDLNIAPLETDVWSHRQLLKVVSHTPVETAAMARLMASRDWVDAVRAFIPPSERLYTWWSYRSPDWEKADKGRRLDHVWVTPALRPALRGAEVVKAMRRGEPVSDHVPVVVDLAGEA